MLKVHSIQSHSHSNDPNMFLTLHSQDAVSIFLDDLTSNRAININESNFSCTNLCIEEKKRSQKTQRTSRKAGNTSVKKLGTTLFNLFHHKKQAQNKKVDIEFSSIKQQIKQSSSRALNSKHKVTHSQLLEARSIQLDEELRQLHTKRQDEKIEKNIKNSKSCKKNTQVQKIQLNRQSSVPQFTTNQSLKNIHRKLQTQPKSDIKQTEKNGFYTKLKMKLKYEMQKIEAKKHQGKENLLIQGCKILKFDPQIDIRRKPLTDRPRPQSSLARTGLVFQASQFSDKGRRPKSSRSRTVQRKEIEYMSVTADDLFKDKPKTRPRTCKGSLTKKNEFNFQSTMNKTLKHVSPLYLAKSRSICKNEVQNQKIKEKMLTLLVQCDTQTNQYSDLNSGLKVFESFTNRMNKGLSKVSKMLQYGQSMNDQYAQFLEK